MPVVEITQLRLKGMTADDPRLFESLSLVRDKLQSKSRFFSCIDDSSLIYIFGFWESLDAHLKFLASPARGEVLGPQEEILDFQWTIHLDLDILSPSFFETSFIALQRLECNADHVEACNRVIDEHVRALQIVASSNTLYRWRCDMPTGSFEAAILTRQSSQGSIKSEAGSHLSLNNNDKGLCREIVFHYAQNMEAMQSRA